MSVSNGSPANASTFNTAFLSRTVASSTIGVVTLNNTSDPNSGAQVTNAQRAINELEDTTGMAGEGDATRKNYSSNNVVTNGDNHKVAIGKIDAKFHVATGHTHDGANSAPIIDAALAQQGAVNTGAQTFGGLKTFNGGLKTDKNLALKVTDQATTASITALAITTSTIRFTGSTATTLHGIATGVDGIFLTLLNASSAVITVKHQSGSAAAADRIITPSGGDFTINANNALILQYDATDSRWRFASGGASSGGGSGGTTLRWYQPDFGSALKSVQSNGVEIFAFTNAETSTIFCKFTLPSSHVSGTQLFLKKGKAFSATTSGNFLFRTVAYIFKANIDATSTPTGYTSTNSQQAIDATTNEIVTIDNIDLTNASGEINAVAVASGDTILVKLQRLPGTETSGVADDVNVLIDSFELVTTA